MAISGEFNFDPSLGAIVIGAYSRCGMRRTQLTSQHMQDAYFEANMLQSEFQGDGLQTWQVSLESLDIVAGQGVYQLPSNIIFILDVYIRQGVTPGPTPSGAVGWLNANGYPLNWTNINGYTTPWTGASLQSVTPQATTTQSQFTTDRIILPFSRSDYAAIANKYQQGFPTSYWWDRTTPGQIYLWPVPPWSIPGGLKYYAQHRPDDAVLKNGTQVDIPYEVYDYFTWSLAERLAYLYAPDRLPLLAPRKEIAYRKYLQATTENVPITINAQLRGYFR